MTAMGTGAEGWHASTSFTRTPLACVMLMFIQLSSHVFNLDQGIQSLATGAGWQGSALSCLHVHTVGFRLSSHAQGMRAHIWLHSS